ncbi:STAS domain-containing protein [Pedobacter sp.]|uniref:STAS domain-containing protein n=1 Tax=Pedobacter sp. TaxID=1411316 RepID=UPI003D7FE676
MGTNIFEILQQSNSVILDRWIQNQMSQQGQHEDATSAYEIKEQSRELLNLLVKNLNANNIEEINSRELEPVIDSLSEIAINRAKQGYSPKETEQFVRGLKTAILAVMEEQIEDYAVLYHESKKINNLFDNLCLLTFETFIKGREEVILRQTDEISEISTPVIRVWDGILAMPIIGTLDSARTQVVMENLLQAIVETGSSIAILDISGVPAVDSLVAQHLMKTVAATRLMGAECVISGIRPEIAQTIVHLGIDLSNIITKATLAHALRFSFQTLKLEVKKQMLVK